MLRRQHMYDYRHAEVHIAVVSVGSCSSLLQFAWVLYMGLETPRDHMVLPHFQTFASAFPTCSLPVLILLWSNVKWFTDQYLLDPRSSKLG
jgi:hypothetical protein